MKGRKGRSTGGTDEAEEDVKDKPEARTNAKKIDSEAEEMKKGGRAKRKSGGKLIGKVEGKSEMHAGRKPRKSGGKATSDANPFTSARSGQDAPGRKVMKGELGMGET